MIRLKDEAGRWVHDVLIGKNDEIVQIEYSQHVEFAKLFDKNDPIVKELVDRGDFEIVE